MSPNIYDHICEIEFVKIKYGGDTFATQICINFIGKQGNILSKASSHDEKKIIQKIWVEKWGWEK